MVGHVADRYDRRLIVAICQAVQACAVLVLTLGILGGWLHIAGIYGVIAVFGGARAFEQPTASALLPGTVDAALEVAALIADEFGVVVAGRDRPHP